MKSGVFNRQAELYTIYTTLQDAYGSRNWWPAESPFEVIIGAILTQNTSWKNVEKAIGSLKREKLLSPERLARAPDNRLARLIRPSGYFNQKTRKLKAFLSYFNTKYHGEIALMIKEKRDVLRDELLNIFGIGEETADSILLYALGKTSFVIDAYTRRILSRIGFDTNGWSYSELKAWVEERIPRETAVYNEFHALLVHHGKHFCKKKPACADCVLNTACSYYFCSAD